VPRSQLPSQEGSRRASAGWYVGRGARRSVARIAFIVAAVILLWHGHRGFRRGRTAGDIVLIALGICAIVNAVHGVAAAVSSGAGARRPVSSRRSAVRPSAAT
jgi:hypothetical protein